VLSRRLVESVVATAVLGLVFAAGSGGAPASCAWRLSPVVVPDGESTFSGVDARTPDDVWAVGAGVRFDALSTEKGATIAEHWNGRRWRLVATPAFEGALLDVAAVAADDAWAVGKRGDSPLVEHWDGQRWRVVATPHVRGPSRLSSVEARSPDNVWAAGSRLPREEAPNGSPLVEHWDGRRWSVVATPRWASSLDSPHVSLSSNSEVWTPCLRSRDGHRWRDARPPATRDKAWRCSGYLPLDAHDPDDVWVDFRPMWRWDGSRWQQHPLPDENIIIRALAAVSEDDVWAGGYFYVKEAEYGALYHWDGSRWRGSDTTFARKTKMSQVADLSELASADIWAVGGVRGINYENAAARAAHFSCRP